MGVGGPRLVVFKSLAIKSVRHELPWGASHCRSPARSNHKWQWFIVIRHSPGCEWTFWLEFVKKKNPLVSEKTESLGALSNRHIRTPPPPPKKNSKSIFCVFLKKRTKVGRRFARQRSQICGSRFAQIDSQKQNYFWSTWLNSHESCLLSDSPKIRVIRVQSSLLSIFWKVDSQKKGFFLKRESIRANRPTKCTPSHLPPEARTRSEPTIATQNWAGLRTLLGSQAST